MSFILDALKKLEQKRQRNTIPDLLKIQDAIPQKEIKRPVWPYLLLIALLLNAGLFLMWLHPWNKDRSRSVPVQDARQDAAPTTPAVATALPVPEKAQSSTPSGPEKRAAGRSQDSAEKKTPERTAPAEPPNRAPHEQVVSKIPPVSDKRVLSLDELPLQVRKDLPDINISLHLYANDPADRLARINDRNMREGETVTGGLKVEEITATGVIFSYQGLRFRMGNF